MMAIPRGSNRRERSDGARLTGSPWAAGRVRQKALTSRGRPYRSAPGGVNRRAAGRLESGGRVRLKDKVALITGGATGLGLATARRFAREGARLVLMGRRAAKIEAAAAGLGARAVVGDSAVEADIERAVGAAQQDFGRLDILVSSTGNLAESRNVRETELAGFMESLNGNLVAPALAARAAARAMTRGGAIVLIGSTSGLIGSQNRFAYATAKSGLVGMTRQMAVTLGRDGIRVNLVAPGLIPTEFNEGYRASLGAERLAAVTAAYPMGHLGDPDDIANACLYLASDEAKWVTGVILAVDGGLTAG
ncbi:MAG: SDR family oxidoreductase [Alphaproteobacteria bacterium]|nr:SDR family oxidoreductase [Alphaproteobacteria bacterium]